MPNPQTALSQVLSKVPTANQFPFTPGGITADHLRPNPIIGSGGSFLDILQRLAGRVAGSSGMRGPDQNPFTALARFAGPFGNGGGAMTPTFGAGLPGGRFRFMRGLMRR